MSDPDEITNEIDDRERAMIEGHAETKQRLLESPRWDEDDVDDLLTAVDGYEHFARCVLGEIRFDRDEES